MAKLEDYMARRSQQEGIVREDISLIKNSTMDTDAESAQIVNLIRQKYSLTEELAILRKALAGDTTEFVEYNKYVEECKKSVKGV